MVAANRSPGAVLSLSLFIFFLFMVLVASGEWVDYPSGVRCCSDIPVERCDPLSPDANAACRDVCHYGGCRRGGRCEGAPAVGRVCRCHC